jgi:hypothetical protein
VGKYGTQALKPTAIVLVSPQALQPCEDLLAQTDMPQTDMLQTDMPQTDMPQTDMPLMADMLHHKLLEAAP